jgi:hypothetical protein
MKRLSKFNPKRFSWIGFKISLINISGCIHNTQFTLTNKLECCIIQGWKGLPRTNTLTYSTNS